MKLKLSLLLIVTLFLCNRAMSQTDYIGSPKIPSHPRILMNKSDEKAIQKIVREDQLWNAINRRLISSADTILKLPKAKYKLYGGQLLNVSRECLRRIFRLAYAYRMTGDPRYAEYAEAQMLEVANYPAWNVVHYLDVAEMTTGMAIGYDWLYTYMSEAQRKKIRAAIIEKGLNTSVDTTARHTWWLNADHNWNQVCNTGMALGALAVMEHEPELAKMIINRSIEKIKIPMKTYAPEGVYNEGPTYWSYGTSFNTLLISALEKAFGSDYGLPQMAGYMNTGSYSQQVITPALNAFGYADNGSKASANEQIFWFYNRTKDPSLLYMQKRLLEQELANDRGLVGGRLAPAYMIWGAANGVQLGNLPVPTNLFYLGIGENPIATMRSSWEDPNATYLAIKGGTPSVNHGHMDVGTFIFESNGIRWAYDLGADDYIKLQEAGVDLWNLRQESQRWDVFRYNNKAHNTLTFNDKNQTVAGHSSVIAHGDNPEMMYATVDMSEVYPQVKSVKRTAALVDKRIALIEDVVESGRIFTKMRWNMITNSAPKIMSGNMIELSSGDKKLYIKIESPAKVRIRIHPAKGVYTFDSPNPNTFKLGFEVDLERSAKQSFRVWLMPDKDYDTSNIKPILN